MFERFTKDARRVVATATTIAQGLVGRRDPARSTSSGRCSTTRRRSRCWCSRTPAPRRRTLRDELDRRRMRYVDGLDADDAEALAAIGIDLDEVVRRIDGNLGRHQRPAADATAVPLGEEGARALAARGDRDAARLHRLGAPAARARARGRPGGARHPRGVRHRAGRAAQTGGGRRTQGRAERAAGPRGSGGSMGPMGEYRPADDRYDTMDYRFCGRSGLQLPALSLGLWQNFGTDRPEETQRAILRRAFDRGVTHFDLANNYGPPYGRAEENFGRYLREDFAGAARRAGDLDEGRLRHVARPLRAGRRVPQVRPRLARPVAGRGWGSTTSTSSTATGSTPRRPSRRR